MIHWQPHGPAGIEDYVLAPAPLRAGRYLWLRRHQGVLYAKKGALFRAIKATLAKSNRAAPTSSASRRR
jgi:hypothetical protein